MANSVVDIYRKNRPDDSRPDDALTFEVGQWAEKNNQKLLEDHPDFAKDYRNVLRSIRRSPLNEFKGAFGQAVDNSQATFLGAGAMLSDLVGWDSARDYLAKQAQEQERQAAEFQPSVPSYKDVETPGDAGYYALYGAAAAAPSMITAAGTAAIGAAIGSGSAPGPGTVSGAAAGFVERKAIQNLIKRGVEKITREALEKEMKVVGASIGGQVGLGLSSIPQAQGDIYNSIQGQPGAAGIAASYGVLSGLLDMVPESYVFSRFFKPGEKITKEAGNRVLGYLGRLAEEASKTIPMEGSTEAAQEFINWAAEKHASGAPATITDKDVERFTNAGLLGAVGGALFGPAAAFGGREAIAPSVGQEQQKEQRNRQAPSQTYARQPTQVGDLFGPPSPAQESAGVFASAIEENRSEMGAAGLRANLFRQRAQAEIEAAPALGQGVDVTNVTTPVDNYLGVGNAQPAEFDYLSKVSDAVQRAAEAQARSDIAAQQAPVDEFSAAQPAAISMQGTDSGASSAPSLGSGVEASLSPAPNSVTEQERIAMPLTEEPPLGVSAAPIIFDGQKEMSTEVGRTPQVGDLAAVVQPTAAPSETVPTAPVFTGSGQLKGLQLIRDLRNEPMTRDERLAEAKTVAGRNAVNSSGVVYIHDRQTDEVHQRPFYSARDKWMVGMAQKRGSDGGVANSRRTVDFDAATEGAPIGRVLDQTMPDSSPRYDIVGYGYYDSPGSVSPVTFSSMQEFNGSPDVSALMKVGYENAPIGERTRGRRPNSNKKVSLDAIEGAVSLDKRAVVSALEGSAEQAMSLADEEAAAQRGRTAPTSTEPMTNVPTESMATYGRALTSDVAIALSRGESIGVVRQMIMDRLRRAGLTDSMARGEGRSFTDVADYVLSIARELNDSMANLTRRASVPFRLPEAERAAKFDNAIQAIRASGGDVFTYERAASDAVDGWASANGLQLNGADGRSLVGLGLDAVNDTGTDRLIALLHETAHHFLESAGADSATRVRFQSAVDQMHWSQQRWLNNPLSTDLRLIANADPASLSRAQTNLLESLPQDQIDKLRQTPPDTLLREQAAEHLAMLGMDPTVSRGLVSQVIRATKDLMLRLAMAVQRTLKGDRAVSDRLVRQFVENRWLQFVNRDFAASGNTITSLRNWIGAPATYRELTSETLGTGGGDQRVGDIDISTGQWLPAGFVPEDGAQAIAKIRASIANAEGSLASATFRSGIPMDAATLGRTRFNVVDWRTIPISEAAPLPIKIGADATPERITILAQQLSTVQVQSVDGRQVSLTKNERFGTHGGALGAVIHYLTGSPTKGERPVDAKRAEMLRYVPATLASPSLVYQTDSGNRVYVAKYRTQLGVMTHMVVTRDDKTDASVETQYALTAKELSPHLDGVITYKKGTPGSTVVAGESPGEIGSREGTAAPDQSELTPRVNLTVRKSISQAVRYTPETQINSEFAVVNYVDEAVSGVYSALRAVLPRDIHEADNPQAAFFKQYLGMRETSHPQVMREVLRGEAMGLKDPTTGANVRFNDRTRIKDLVTTREEYPDIDGKLHAIELNSARDYALAGSLSRLYSITKRVQERLASAHSEYDRLDARKTLSEQDLARKSYLGQTAALLDRVLNEPEAGLKWHTSDLERKIGAAPHDIFYPGAPYLVPSTTDADPSKFVTKVIPRDMRFSPKLEQEFISHLAAMRKWLDNEDNYRHAQDYGRMLHQWNRLNEEFSTTYTYAANTVRLRKSMLSSLPSVLRNIGTPNALHASKFIYRFQEIVDRHSNDARIYGSAWSKAYQNLIKAMGRRNDEAFREQVWDTMSRVFEQINEGDKDPVGLARRILAKNYSFEIADGKQLDAFKELVRETRESQRFRRRIFEELGLKVDDPSLVTPEGRAVQRRLLDIGYFNGQRHASRMISSLYLEMRDRWSNTEDGPSLVKLGDVLDQHPEIGGAMAKAYFTDAVKRNFVDPLVRSNSRFITLRDENGIGDLVSQNSVQDAWRKAGDDVVKFARNLHRIESRGGPESQTINDVMASFASMYESVKRESENRNTAEASGVEALPRQMMDARLADNWPPEWVGYSKYDTTSNFVFAMQSSLNHAFGRNGFGTNGEFHAALRAVRENLQELRNTERNLRAIEGLSPKEIRQRMGDNEYRIALQADDHLYMLRNFDGKMRAITKTTGYLLADMRILTDLIHLQAGMMLQQPKSAGLQLFDVIAPLYKTKFSSQSLSAIKQAFSSVFSDGVNSLAAAVGSDFAINTDNAIRRRDSGIKDPDNYITWKQKMADAETRFPESERPDQLTERAGRATSVAIRAVRNAMDVGTNDILPNRTAKALGVKFRPFGIFSAVSRSVTNGLVDGLYNNMADLATRGVDFIEQSGDPERVARELEAGTLKLDPGALGYTRKWMFVNDKAAYDYLADALTTKMAERSIEDFVAKAWRRMKSANGEKWEAITDRQFRGIANIATSEYSLQANAVSSPIDMLTSPGLRAMSVFLMWPWNAAIRAKESFRDARGRLTVESMMDGLTLMFMGAIPATLAGSLAVDFYDEKVAGKKSNLRQINPTSIIPGVGPAMQPMATLERLARYGTFGLASEMVNGVLNFDDARGGITADNRIFIFNQLKTLRTLLGNLYQQDGNVTYQSIGRPLLQFTGLNGVLQYNQILNHMLRETGIADANNQEAAINERINAGNYLRAAGRALDLDVRIMQGAQSMPTPITPYIQQMELGATVGNYQLFREAYARAIQEAAKAGKDDPVKYVKQAFASRHPLRRIYRTLPSEQEYTRILSSLDEDGRLAVSRSVASYNRFLEQLKMHAVMGKRGTATAPNAPEPTMSLAEARRIAAQAAYDFTLGQ